MNITITECKSDGRVWEYTARTKNRDEAVTRAIHRYWGKAAWFWQDHGMPYGYGQIMSRVSQEHGGGSTSETGRIRIDVKGVR